MTPSAPEPAPSPREFLERLMNERDRLYDTRIRALEATISSQEKQVAIALAGQEKQVSAALAAQEKQTASSFVASEKAIVKAEDAQKEYNARSNEFRGQLDDQAKMLMPRSEVVSLLAAMDEKVRSVKSELETRIHSVQITGERAVDALQVGLTGVRESFAETRSLAPFRDRGMEDMRGELKKLNDFQSGTTGKSEGQSATWTAISLGLGVILALIVIGGFLFLGTRQAEPVAPTVIYTPAPAGTQLPTVPPAGVPR